jgi:hypothetical protein
LLGNKGEDLLRLKRHGGWESSSTAEGYIEDCVENKIQFARKIPHGVTNKEFSKPTTSMCNQEDKENSGYENFDNANVAASPLILFYCNGNEGQLQEPCEFPESANILSLTSVYIKIIIIID